MKKYALCAALVSAVGCHHAPETVADAPQGYCATSEFVEAPAGTLEAERIEMANNTAPGLYEGPVWIDDTLYFSHFTFGEGFPSNILAFNGDALTVALADSGSNGLAKDDQGRILAGTHKYKSVSQYDRGTWQRAELAGQYQGRVFNSPNDLTMAADDTLYFTDPGFQRAAAPGGQPVTGVYRVRDGEVSLIDASIENPNGISLSPDQQTLYVAGGGEDGFVRAYDLSGEKPVSLGNILEGVQVPDGMAVDCLGNLYVTEHTAQQIRVITPEGEVIARIPLDANVTNAAFGGEQGTTLFITGAGALWQLDLGVKGLPY